MTDRYNPPPNWPPPPAGWTPPKDWQPDPAWGPAPPGHQLWVPASGTPAAPQPNIGYGAAPLQQESPKKKSKKWLWITLGVILVLALLSQCGGDDEPTASTTPTAPAAGESSAPDESSAPAETTAPAEQAIVVSAQEMIDLLEGNALNAKNTYEDKRVTVSGVVGNIDASGNYFALDPEPDAFILTGIQVQTSEEFLDQVASFSQGQAVTVTGTVTNVGEILGYSIEAETIQP